MAYAELGDHEQALPRLRRFVADAEPTDQRLTGARMSLAVMLVASGDVEQGDVEQDVAELRGLRDAVRAADGPVSVQVRNLDRQIARLSDDPGASPVA